MLGTKICVFGLSAFVGVSGLACAQFAGLDDFADPAPIDESEPLAGQGGVGGPSGGGMGGLDGGEGGGGGSGGAGATGGGCPQTLNDDFSDPCTLDQWLIGGSETATTFSIEAESLIGNQRMLAAWFESDTSGLRYKVLDGNFRFETNASALTAVGAYPVDAFHNAGIVIQSPLSSDDWIEITVGAQLNAQNAVSLKSTVDGVSARVDDAIGSTTARLRLCRIGSNISGYRFDGATWVQVGTTQSRPDLGGAVRVGFVVSAFEGSADLIGSFEYADFDTQVDNQSDCNDL